MPDYSKGDVALAIVLTFAAGLSTVIGAAVSFCVKPHCVQVLPIALAFSAGVMIYVSFVEIWGEAKHGFEVDLERSHPNSAEVLSHVYVSITFFGGILTGYLLDYIVHLLGYNHHLLKEKDVDKFGPGNVQLSEVAASTNASKSPPSKPEIIEEHDSEDERVNQPLSPTDERPLNPQDTEVLQNDSVTNYTDDQNLKKKMESKHLMKTSLITALAIALHNFPEGLATFVSTLADPALGFSIAVAIAIHNIPEGIAVAMPVYFATHSKWKAFFWSFLSGIAEPIGGLVGFAIINSLFSETVFGVLFGYTAGIMIYISFKELLPTARKRDTNDKYTTILVFLGFLVMDISLILFEIPTK